MSDTWMKKIKEFALNLRNGKRIRRRSGKLKNDNLNLLDNKFNCDAIRINGKLKGFNKKRHHHDNHIRYNSSVHFDD
jgi:hypothetical protein